MRKKTHMENRLSCKTVKHDCSICDKDCKTKTINKCTNCQILPKFVLGNFGWTVQCPTCGKKVNVVNGKKEVAISAWNNIN